MTDRGASIRNWVEQQISGARFERSRVLAGATSSTVLELRLRRGDAPLSLILRLFTNTAWLTEEPDLARHEAAVLAWLTASDLPVPELIAVDESGEVCGVPAVLMTKVPGRVELLPDDRNLWLDQQADTLARIHGVASRGFGWRYRSWNQAFAVPNWSPSRDLWQRAVDLWCDGPPDEPDRFLHRDYHPLNTLWHAQRLSGVVDWVNACVGPAATDVSHCRGNLVQMYGPDAADRFLTRYLEQVPGFEYHPYWDLEALATFLPEPGGYGPWAIFGLGAPPPRLLHERCEQFLERALARW